MCLIYLEASCTVLPFLFFFFNDTATTEIYTLSLHDALPISPFLGGQGPAPGYCMSLPEDRRDRKSTRLNSSHEWISYADFCLKKKKATPPSLCRRTHTRSTHHNDRSKTTN